MKKIIGILSILIITVGLVACGDKEETKSDLPVKDILNAMKEKFAEDLEGGELIDGEIEGFIEADLTEESADDPFLDSILERMEFDMDDLDEGLFFAPMMNVNSDQIIVLKANDVDSVAALKEALEIELEAQHSVWEQYLPDQFDKVKNNIITTEGVYLTYITSENPEALEKVFKEKIQ